MRQRNSLRNWVHKMNDQLEEFGKTIIEIGNSFKIDKLMICGGNDNQGEYVGIQVTALGGVYTHRVYGNALEKGD